jgi:hypothetical protein
VDEPHDDERHDPDDWFDEPDVAGMRGVPDAPSAEDAAPDDDWLNEQEHAAASPRPGLPPWVNRRVIAVSGSLIVLLIAALAAAGVFSGHAPAPATTLVPTTTAPTTTTPTTTAQRPQVPAPTATLKPGDTGTQVAALQRALASLGFSSGKADGDYGPATTQAVTRFQRAKGLTADGIFGPATLEALRNALRGA